MDKKTYEALVKEMFDTWNRKGLKPVIFTGTVDITLKGASAGQYHYAKNMLRFNDELLSRYPDQLALTVAHEVAHYIARQAYQGKGHGATWKQVMRVLGYPAFRTHHMQVNYKHGTFLYKCACGTYRFSKIRHNKVQRGKVYICKTCKTELFFEKELKHSKEVGFILP